MLKIRTRYAPSPTGHLHIGGARTALFCYLFAKSKDGEFLVRLEDTDKERNLSYGEDNQLDGLEWIGIKADFSPRNPGIIGPFRQSERIDIYNKYIEELIQKGHAYKCWCTAKELEADRKAQKARGISSPIYNRKCLHNPKPKEGQKPAIRIIVPNDAVYKWKDAVRGKMEVSSSAIGDWIIRKSEGLPTYNFANVIDDHLMGITHVHRGEEHLSNTPKQIQLYKIFGWNMPEFLHLTIIINSEGKKLSKRDKNVLQFVHLYRERGYLPEAIFNYLSLLGWSPEGEEEIFSQEELIKIFTHKRLSKAPSKYDIKKLQWTNNQYIQNLSKEKLVKFLSPFVIDSILTEEQKEKVFLTFQPGLHEGIEIANLIKNFEDEYSIDEKNIEFLNENQEVIRVFIDKIQKLKNWEKDLIKQELMLVGDELKLKGRSLMMPIRLKTTGKTFGADIASILEIFGKEKTLRRLLK